MIDENDVREEVSRRDVNGAAGIENFPRVILFENKLEQASALEVRGNILFLISFDCCVTVAHSNSNDDIAAQRLV